MDEQPKSKRAWVGIALIVLVVAAMFASDPKGTSTLGRCLLLGEGRFFGEVPNDEFHVDYFGNTYIGTGDNMIDWYVYVFGGWERSMLAAMEDVLELTDPGGGVVVDVGANVGTHSIYISDHAKTVHAIEPWPTVLDRMDAMVKASNIDNVVIHPVGFSEEAGVLPYNIPRGDNLGAGSFSKQLAEQRHFDQDGQIDLPLVVADEYFADKKVSHIDLVKIDIEGYEKGALRGMTAALKRYRPVVFMELNVANEEGFHSEEELRATYPKDYAFFELFDAPMYDWSLGSRVLACGNARGNYTLVPFDMDFSHGERNLVAMPADVAKRLAKLPPRATIEQ